MFEGLFDGGDGDVLQKSHTDGSGEILKVAGAEERGGKVMSFVLMFDGEGETLGGELIFGDVEISLGIAKGVGFDRGVFFKI